MDELGHHGFANCKCVIEPVFDLDEAIQQALDDEVRADLIGYAVGDSRANAVLAQFVEDGGEPWDIYRIEQSLFGETLEQMARSSNWQMF